VQTLAQLLPTAEVGLIQLNVMNNVKFTVIGVSIWMTAMAVISPVIIYNLDQATAKQCITHDWPAAADRIHKDWCIDNGYKIN
jgi:hypothetical protein